MWPACEFTLDSPQCGILGFERARAKGARGNPSENLQNHFEIALTLIQLRWGSAYMPITGHGVDQNTKTPLKLSLSRFPRVRTPLYRSHVSFVTLYKASCFFFFFYLHWIDFPLIRRRNNRVETNYERIYQRDRVYTDSA